METNLIIKGGEKELDLLLKADVYFNSITPKWWEIKENNTISLRLRHGEKFPLPKKEKVYSQEKGRWIEPIYTIEELISALEKNDKEKVGVNLSKEQDFLSAYENYKNENREQPMKAQEQKVSELTYKFNKRLDVVIKANPNENFVVEDREKSEEMLKNKLYRLRGSNHPLQNQAIKYLQQDILELRTEERNLEIAQGKQLGTLFVSQTPLDNLLAIFEKLAERKTELQQEQNEKLKNIAEKSLTDTNYLFLFDEKTREEVQKFAVDTAKSQNQLTPQSLTAEDYLAISDKLAEEMSISTQMTKGMTVTEISEKSTHYYQKYEFQIQKEQEQLKVRDMENNIQQETQLNNVEKEENNEVKTEQPTQNSVVDYSEKLDYLKKHIKYLGFGESEQLHKDLEEGIKSPKNEFSIQTNYENTMKGNRAKFELFFKKTENGGVFFNSYRGDLLTNKGDFRSHTFQTQHNITAKELVNLLEGRAIKIEREIKNEETQETNKEPAFIKLNFKENKNEYGNYKLEMFSKNFGIDVDKIMEKAKLTYFDEEHKELIKKHLEKGNITKVTFLTENKNSKGVFETQQGFAVLNPQYKMLNLYDEKMNRINSNTASQQLEITDNQKKNVPEQNRTRGI